MKKPKWRINQLALYIVKRSPLKHPNCYTTVEGGNWIDWPKGIKFNYKWLKLRSPSTVTMGDLYVHSLAFGIPIAGFDQIQRWDCVNGFDRIVLKPFY